MEAFLAQIAQKIKSSPYTGITADGRSCRCLTFCEYMNIALYDPQHGYYRSGAARIGRDGDFYTSAYIGDVMGSLLAGWLSQTASRMFPHVPTIEVWDWGGGTGRLSSQMLATWKQAGDPGERFRLTLVDDNPAHLAQARELLAEPVADGRARVMSSLEAESAVRRDGPVIVVANELLDAFPVHRVTMVKGDLRERGVAFVDGQLADCLMTPTNPALAAWLQAQNVELAEGQTTEIGLPGAAWMEKMASLLGPAVVVLIDYGDTTQELTGSHRMDGTLVMYDRHLAHGDPYRRPGKQDMTAHVDFDLIRDRAVRAGWQEQWYGTQKQFLVEAGALSMLVDHNISDPFHPIVRRNRAIRQLLLSDGMSELFKVQVWAKSH